jgi:hypothetical protein
MAIKFDELLDDDEAAVIDSRDIFLTLNRDKKFAFLFRVAPFFIADSQTRPEKDQRDQS